SEAIGGPVWFYSLLNKKDKPENEKYSDHSLKYPPGFTPNDDTNEFCLNEENVRSVNDDNPQNCNVDGLQTGQEGNSANKGSKTCVNLLIVVVYDPHDLRDKRLEEVPLGGSSFTWCHKSSTKMSKLDRFNTKRAIEKYKEELEALDAAIDKGNGSYEIVNKRMEDCGTDKSPGPDGFTFGFYRHFWSTIENDVFEAVKHFCTYGNIPKGCNSSFIALILKIPDANLVKDFRPISLIGNRSFILNEVLQWCKLKKKQSLIFKVDFEKAYDSVRWDFLDDVLKKFGFGNKWCAWIQSCLRSLRGSSIINGSPTEEFQLFKGLKQGDPLSPFLFILIMESLHLSFQRVVDAGMFMGIKLSPSLNLSHMFYVDDAVFVGQWCDGTKVGGSMSRVQAWMEVVDKVKSRLCNWKMKALSIGSRLTLLKSVLRSMPIFHKSIFRVPLSVLRMLESIRSHVFNGHELRSNKATWVTWNSVLASKEKEGLGVSCFYAFNRGLMLKWVWWFYSQKTSLWARVVKAIHGDDGKVGKVTNAGIRSCWMNIVNEISVMKNQGVNVFDFMRLKLGNGDTTAFWEDNWISGNVLKDLYRVGVVFGEFSVAFVRKIDALPTRLNISRRGIDIDSILCPICDCGVESSSHLFFSCSLARQVARKISLWWDVTYVDVNSYVEDTVQIETAVNTISQEYLLEFTSEYGIRKALHPELPRLEDRIVDLPEGKCYTKPLDSLKNWNNRFFWVDERVFPTVVDCRSSDLKDGMSTEITYSAEAVRILDTHRTPIQKQPEALLCLVGLSRRYYLGDEVYHTFLHDNDRVGIYNLATCLVHKISNQLLALYCRYGPVQFNPRSQSQKVKTRSCPRAAYEVSLLIVTANRLIEVKDPTVTTDSSGIPSTIERSQLDFANEAGPEDQGTMVPEVPLPEDVPTTRGAPEAGQAERVTATDPPCGLPRALLRQEIRSLRIPPLLPWSGLLRAYTDLIQRKPGPTGAMGSQLRLRFEQEVKLLKKSVAQVARRDKRIQAREHEIKNLEALLEAEADMKKAAKDKNAKLSQELEDMRTLFSNLRFVELVDAAKAEYHTVGQVL
nr:RNA-directed DNA polymerase, eukaryota, reverse transcriptase zinc-binding domain protein [Tanacetum cinerariifolium]